MIHKTFLTMILITAISIAGCGGGGGIIPDVFFPSTYDGTWIGEAVSTDDPSNIGPMVMEMAYNGPDILGNEIISCEMEIAFQGPIHIGSYTFIGNYEGTVDIVDTRAYERDEIKGIINGDTLTGTIKLLELEAGIWITGAPPCGYYTFSVYRQ